MEQWPFISVILPCRNEEEHIESCLNSILANSYPRNHLEILCIDGESTDRTRSILKDFAAAHLFIRILDNPERVTPYALNLGISHARGDVIIRMDAHATYAPDYIEKCVKYLNDHQVDNVGGIIVTLPRENTPEGRAIALALTSPFGVGNSAFRVGVDGPKEVDTVFGGCYRKEVFRRVGLFNERLTRSQDMDFNLRLKKAGGRILLFPDIKAYYYAPASLRAFFLRNFLNGFWAIYPLRLGSTLFKTRHLVPLAFVIGLVVLALLSLWSVLVFFALLSIVALYCLVDLVIALRIAIANQELKYTYLLVAAFPILHIAYGLGSLWGLVKLLF